MGKTATEFEIKVSSGRITNVNAILENGICKLTIETVAQENLQDVFVLVEASKLSLDDEFMKHEPKTEREETFKEQLTEAIKKGVKDFWRPKYDPSFNEEGTGICYVEGKEPALFEAYDWWKEVARAFCPERRSRLGTKSEYVAFLGVLIKKLIESGWKVEEAWSAVCNDSSELGNYINSKISRYDSLFEDTGSREICGFFDLANTTKILAEDDDSCWVAGGCSYLFSESNPLVKLRYVYNPFDRIDFDCRVGWLVLECV